MRLIDADALHAYFKAIPYADLTGDELNWVLRIYDAIDNTPTIDAEPVRHGRWIQSKTVPSYHSCSYCKRAHNMPKSCNVYVLPYYCMDCGTKMDLEKGIDR